MLLFFVFYFGKAIGVATHGLLAALRGTNQKIVVAFSV
jgi:hypothetical protein